MRKLIRYTSYFSMLCFTLIFVGNSWVKHSSQPYIYKTIEDIPPRTYGLLLGTSKRGKHGENPYFSWRIDAAIELYRAGKIDSILVSGDNSIKEYDETTDMYNSLVERGIPSEHIILDHAGFRTLDSVIRAKKVFNCQELIIVSQEFHNQRALYIALMNGIDAVAYNARDSQHRFNYTHFREYLAKTWTLIEVHLLGTQPKFL